mmetsp:Transcript_1654/g.5754  ORF Transcript_1654/g.5754 Transcript_1654/m.5754 type:complete len:101 (-) Transcript_1654:1349-1651(-)
MSTQVLRVWTLTQFVIFLKNSASVKELHTGISLPCETDIFPLGTSGKIGTTAIHGYLTLLSQPSSMFEVIFVSSAIDRIVLVLNLNAEKISHIVDSWLPL